MLQIEPCPNILRRMKLKNFQIKDGDKNVLKKHKTSIQPFYNSDDETKQELNRTQKKLSDLQELLYAQNQWAVLIVLQGMDTAGKDGLIEHVMKSVNPQGCDVTSFKQPTHLELDHDFLWRAHANLPQRGKIGVFNRSYYEDVIVPMVHPQVLDRSQLPYKIRRSKNLMKDRCNDIVHFEKYLARQGVLIIKIFLHLSKNEQKNRLLSRLENEEKNWKFEGSDIAERQHWANYQKAYSFCIQHTSYDEAPWYIIPADDKPTARLIASNLISTKIENLNLAFPKVDAKKKKELARYHHQLKK